ncbi:MAG TPA: TadE/TadG family type IV pilus assembly protein [Candidatus Binatia bacterium]|nr:TadE/TadG family type IV pilus assembly protein [Candidatus Binatia bacterium]
MSVQHDDVARASAGRAPREAGRRESGVALIEAAFVLPILLVLAMGMLDFGRAFQTKSVLDQAAREGARIAVITDPDLASVSGRVNEILAPAGIAATAVTVTGPDAGTKLDHVTVTATFTFMTPGIYALVGGDYGNTISMSSQCVMRHETGGDPSAP